MNNKPTYAQEYHDIVDVIRHYEMGLREAKSSLMKPAFDPQTVMFSVDDNQQLVAVPIQTMFDSVDNIFTSSSNAKIAITHIDIVGAVASARVDINDVSGFCFTDFFHLLKVNGKWTIVNKIYHTHLTD